MKSTVIIFILLLFPFGLMRAQDLPDEIEEIIASGQCDHCDFSGLDLSGRKLSFSHIHSGKFIGTKFKGAEIFISSLASTDFTGADFSNANIVLESVQFNNFKQTNFAGASIKIGMLKGNNFIDTNLAHSRSDINICMQSKFEGTQFTDAAIKVGYIWRHCNVYGGNADGLVFEGYTYNQTFNFSSMRNARFILLPDSNNVLGSEAAFASGEMTGAIVCWMGKKGNVTGVEVVPCFGNLL